MAGQTSGLGLFTIQASHEYLDGGPTKQYQDVHSTPFLINMFNCGHFLSDIRKADDRIEGDWKKLNGPFFIYVNQGKNTEAVWKDAKKKAAEEVAKWPYQWMQHELYPLRRGTVKGSLSVDGKKAVQGTHIILAAPGYDWQAQTQGYIFYTLTDANGNFELKNVREGNYTVYAYGSNQTEEFSKAGVSVTTGKTTSLQLDWKPIKHGDKIWQLGEADRRTKGFNLADSKRNYEVFLKVPAEVNYTIGKSNESKDWYYAQAKDGSWNIHFDMTKEYKGEATLTLALAGAARNPNLEVYVNDTKLSPLPKLGNDASIYRSAIAGGYYQKHELKFAASLLKKTGNVISFKLVKPKLGAGVMYDAVKLEVE